MADKSIAHWRIILAFILDLLSSFIVIGWLVATMFGGITDKGFQLQGWPALLCFVLVIAYFLIGRRLGGTLWARFLGAVREP